MTELKFGIECRPCRWKRTPICRLCDLGERFEELERDGAPTPEEIADIMKEQEELSDD